MTWARRALDADAADAFSRALALSVLPGALTIQGRGAEGLALLADLPRGVTDLTDVEIEGVMARGVSSLWTGDLDTAETDLSVVVSLRTGWRALRVRVLSLSYLAVTEFYLGQWDDSAAHDDLVVSLVHDADYHWVLPVSHYCATSVLAARGQWEAASAHATAARQAAEVIGDASGVGYAGTAGGWLAYCRDDPEGVCRAVEPVLALPHRDGIDEPGVLGWQALHVEALTALGRLDEARAALAPFEQRAAARGHAWAMADGARARARLEAAAGRDEQAGEAFERATRLADEVPMPFEQARIAEAYGAFLRRAGERRRAAARLGAARETYARLDAEPFLARCDRELAACGLSPGPRTPETRRRLTPQELAVARLVAGGLSNRETARELVISVKTVEYHLGNVYTKLGLSSRTQLAATWQPGSRATRPPWPVDS